MDLTGVDEDRVRALMLAERAGLLRYHAYADNDRYAVEICGQDLILPDAQVRPTIARLTAIRDAATVGVALAALTAEGDYQLTAEGGHDPQQRTVAARDVYGWVSGYRAAATASTRRGHTGPDTIARIRDLITNPSLSDQVRMLWLNRLYDPTDPVAARSIAKQLGVSVKAIHVVLKFAERPLRHGRVWELSKALDLDVRVNDVPLAEIDLDENATIDDNWPDVRVNDVPLAEIDPDDKSPAGARITTRPPHTGQMPGLTIMRGVVEADAAGWLRYAGDPAPNTARWQDEWKLNIGGVDHTVDTDDAPGFLAGVRAWHTR